MFGATWNNQGIIVFVPVGGGPIYKVRASGGVPEPVIKITGHESVLWPSFLPDGDHFLYFYNDQGFGQSGEPGPGDGIRVGSLNSTAIKSVNAEMANNIQFASGRIFYVHNRSLMAPPFDSRRMEVTGTPEQIAPQEMEPDVAFSRSGFSVSQNGVVVFQSAADNISRLSWFDRSGKELDSRQLALQRLRFHGTEICWLSLPMTIATESNLSGFTILHAARVLAYPTASLIYFQLFRRTRHSSPTRTTIQFL